MSPIGSRWQEVKLARSGHESQDEVNSYVPEVEVASGRSRQSLKWLGLKKARIRILLALLANSSWPAIALRFLTNMNPMAF